MGLTVFLANSAICFIESILFIRTVVFELLSAKTVVFLTLFFCDLLVAPCHVALSSNQKITRTFPGRDTFNYFLTLLILEKTTIVNYLSFFSIAERPLPSNLFAKFSLFESFTLTSQFWILIRKTITLIKWSRRNLKCAIANNSSVFNKFSNAFYVAEMLHPRRCGDTSKFFVVLR